MEIKRSEIDDIVTVCPYCMNEVGDVLGCCGESCNHFERAYVIGDNLELASECKVIEDCE